MKNKLAKNIQKGFTLVELLVVIGILGILAAALLAVIDPIEQLNKGQDTAKKEAAVEYVGAMQRYYATRQQYPMDVAATNCGTGAGILNVTALSGLANCTTELTSNGEIKASFTSTPAYVLTNVYASRTAVGNPVKACFDPQSKAYSKDSQTIYTDNTGNTATCNPATTTTCYWCAQ